MDGGKDRIKQESDTPVIAKPRCTRPTQATYLARTRLMGEGQGYQ